MNKRARKSAFVRSSRVLRNLSMLLAIGLLLLLVPEKRVSALGEALLLLPIGFAVGVTAHELGHLICARLGRMRPIVFVLGSLWIRFVGPSPRMGLSPAFMSGGFVVAAPKSTLSRSSAILFFIGGILGNVFAIFLCFVVVIVVALLTDSNSTTALTFAISIGTMIAICNVMFAVLASIPRVAYGFMTDGGYVLRALRSRSFVRIIEEAMRLGSQQFEGVPPRDWNRSTCNWLIENIQEFYDPLSILMMAYYIEVDSGNVIRAQELLNEAAPFEESVKTLSVEHFNIESAFFYGFYRPDPSLCKKHIDACAMLEVMPETRDRLEAALAFANGEYDKARRFGELLLDTLSPPISPGLDKYIRSSMAALVSDCKRRIASNAPQAN